ncbi:MAG TPA: hypothetical protein VGM44_23055 [Polyangiaceae bacterium]|jgi:hypothetical protein
MLRAGGALGIAWNTRVLRRDALAKLLTENGFLPRTSAPYLGFEHEVDHAIVRDVMVATKAD